MGVTYTYSGYPMVHEAREMVAAGLLGAIRVVQVEYPLEWMATAIESQGNAQAAWRTDPKKSGHACLPSGRLRHRAQARIAERRPGHVRRRARPRRQRARHA
jgi:hypothetical protein